MQTKTFHNSSMKLIMENWRQFSDLDKLNEDYKQFCETYDRYIVLNESEQNSFLIEEGAFSNIIDFFKELASSIGTRWRALVELFKSNDGILWKVFKFLGWSLESFGELFDAAFEAINTIQRTIIDFAQKNPITGLKGQDMTDWLKQYVQDSDLGNLTKLGIAGILIAAVCFSMLQGKPAPFNPALILAALAGKFTAIELIEEGWFSKIIFSIAGGMALNAAFPGIGLLSIGAMGVIRKLAGAYKFGKFVKGKGKGKTQASFKQRMSARRSAREEPEAV